MLASQTAFARLCCVESVGFGPAAVEGAFVGAIGKDCFVRVIIAVADKRTIEVLFTSQTVEQLRECEHFVVNLLP